MTAQSKSDDESGLLWIPNPTGSHESYWMGIQRFMYLNDLSGEDFLRLQYRRCHPLASPSYSALNRPVEKNITARRCPLPSCCLDSLDGEQMGNKGDHDHLYYRWQVPVRFCPECLSYGYHSLLFQFPALGRCPYHDVELRVTCPVCGDSISILGFIASKHWRPYCCTSCRTAFVPEKEFAQRVLFGLPGARKTLDEAYNWISMISKVDVTSFAGFRHHDDREDRFARFHCHALHAAATHGAPKPSWLTGLQDSVGYRPIRSVAAPINAVGEEEVPIVLTDHLHPMLSVLKSIDRQHSRLIRSVCRHRSSLQLFSAVVQPSYSSSRHFLRLDDLDCPCCAVLTWWRASWGYYFALHKWALLQRYPPMGLRKHMWYAGGSLIDSPARLAQAAWDSFLSFAMLLHYRLTSKTEDLIPICHSLILDSKDGNFAYRHRVRIDAQRDCQNRDATALLDLEPPLDGDGSIVCNDAFGKPCTVSYSWLNAENALAELHELRRAGPLKAIPHRIFRHKSIGTFDIWYLESWIRSERKSWNDDFLMSKWAIQSKV